MENYTVCVIGVGELGMRIAGELSLFGVNVNVYDRDPKKSKNANYQISQQKEELVRNGLIEATDAHGDVTTYTNFSDALQSVDFVFEAIIDDVKIKQWLYEKITQNCKSDAVVCSNTIQLDLEEIAENALFKNRVIGCRFMLPVYRIPIVEVMYTSVTSPEIKEKVETFFKRIEKRIIVRQPDENPKLLTISETRHFWNEAKARIANRVKSNCHGQTYKASRIMDGGKFDQSVCDQVDKKQSFAIDKLVESSACLGEAGHGRTGHGQEATENCENIRTESVGSSVNEENHHSPSICVNSPPYHDGEVSTEIENIISPVQDSKESATNELVSSNELNMRDGKRNDAKNTNVEESVKTDSLEFEGAESPNECILCNDARINCVLDPCGHMWLCYECGKIVQKAGKGCPACRKDINKIIRVFLP